MTEATETQAHLTIEHNGYTAILEWRDAYDGWRPSWWLRIGDNSFPIGGDGERDEVAAEVREKYIGDPPPADHSQIWGSYTCGACGAKGVKLWREYQTFLDAQTLRCRGCCEAHAGKPKPEDGDTIGWHVPAMPTADGSTFWGYTSVPMAVVDWWRALPDAEAR